MGTEALYLTSEEVAGLATPAEYVEAVRDTGSAGAGRRQSPGPDSTVPTRPGC